MRRATTVGLLVPLAAMTLAGCSERTSALQPLPPAPPPTLAPVQDGDVSISARDNQFNDQVVTVKVGSKITWSNDGRNDHNIAGVGDAPFKVATEAFKPKATYTAVATTPGTYTYYCTIHGTETKGMTGTVQVVPK